MLSLAIAVIRRRLRALPLAIAMAMLPIAIAAAAAPAGSVVGVVGNCTVESGGSRGPAKIGLPVQVGDTLDVPADGKMKLRMMDGSVVSLAGGTRMTVAAYSGQDRDLSLAQGLLRSVVNPGSSRFEVDTAVGAAAVRSTDWFIEIAGGAMQVGVLSGSVDMTSRATNRAVNIPARWGARLEAGRDPVPPRLWSPAEFDAVIARTSVP